MNIFVAGATGVIGQPLLKLLCDAGHAVTGTTRSAGKIAVIEALGAHGVVADAFDADALRRAVAAAKPEVVIHQLTDLPDVSDPTQMAAVREKNSRLRIEGTRNLMAAATTDAAAQAALLAVTKGAPGLYNVAEDDGEFSMEKARTALGFDPKFRMP